jgi:hypothetical protein
MQALKIRMVQVVCAHCQRRHDKAASHVSRSGRNGWDLFCDKWCSGAARRKSDTRKRLMARERERCVKSDPEEQKKRAIRRATRAAIAKGLLIREACGVCGSVNTEAHHDDYSKPLEVRWLCRKHHNAHHLESAANERTPILKDTQHD